MSKNNITNFLQDRNRESLWAVTFAETYFLQGLNKKTKTTKSELSAFVASVIVVVVVVVELNIVVIIVVILAVVNV